jgi:3-hydroxyacyl-[acyl-carrier-protein] dehydratase
MRWLWVDRFVEFERGKYAKAVKTISLTDVSVNDHCPSCPVMPASLIIEGVAQTGGLLVCEQTGFTKSVVLAKIPRATFLCEAVPGDTLTYIARIERFGDRLAIVRGTSHHGSRLQADMEIVLAHVVGADQHHASIDPRLFKSMMRIVGGFELVACGSQSDLRRACEGAMASDAGSASAFRL